MATGNARTLILEFGWQLGGSFRSVAMFPKTNHLILLQGWVAEWLKAPVLKTGRRASVSWVQIPPHPPILRLHHPMGACDLDYLGGRDEVGHQFAHDPSREALARQRIASANRSPL